MAGSTIFSSAKSFRIVGLLTSRNSDNPSMPALRMNASLSGLENVPRAKGTLLGVFREKCSDEKMCIFNKNIMKQIRS